MKLSKDRILTTHVGSLPRSEQVFKLVFEKEDGKDLDKKEIESVNVYKPYKAKQLFGKSAKNGCIVISISGVGPNYKNLISI